ncbi:MULTISPECIES: GNAT family N-acetyltransferase [Thermoanaerobacterium]|uniref:N-acetyltransferase GCN5 n=2 Tax=Thermoanaerobacterium TaxID=28895 RepID=W9E7A5_9THEO|nr:MULTISPECIES: GNAT family N-acetyltransferase [Thermoanaerobacterium]AFK86374.1 GCN5-related N-acetyltransferase [Thermoanaerobacterium saccharolyticum JW/SL-YS485]ETO37152.1 N-acetyltransferase GCN5 [Thermoanaerobacterium aotearoense SCUT27]
MFFGLKGFYIDSVENKDLNEVVEVYNSNKHFLLSHMDKEKVTKEWILQELESMKEVGFHSCKIVEISSEKIIGVMDFKVGKETYLSLLMIHNDFKSKGFGKLIFRAFEEYAKSQRSKCIRIDVVTNYDNSVLDFWIKNGFTKFKNVELNWTGKILPAITMKKNL